MLPDDFKSVDAKLYYLGSVGKTYQIDEIDYKILNEIVVNARIPILELAYKISCSSKTVKICIKNLIKNGIILKFRVTINISKLSL